MVDPYAWHRKVLAGERPPLTMEPECGWFLWKRAAGEMIPASIYWERQHDAQTGEIIGDDILRCEIAGTQADPEEMWLWLSKRPISKEEYDMWLSKLFMEG